MRNMILLFVINCLLQMTLSAYGCDSFVIHIGVSIVLAIAALRELALERKAQEKKEDDNG